MYTCVHMYFVHVSAYVYEIIIMYMYVCVCTCLCLLLCIFMYVSVYIGVLTNMHLCMYGTYVCMHVCLLLFSYVYVCVCICKCMCGCMYLRTYVLTKYVYVYLSAYVYFISAYRSSRMHILEKNVHNRCALWYWSVLICIFINLSDQQAVEPTGCWTNRKTKSISSD